MQRAHPVQWAARTTNTFPARLSWATTAAPLRCHFHCVEPNPGGRRIALAFFLGLTTTGQLIAWS
ncbi:hypothetical protein QCN29_15270 [Streptomyces sp. HNM0663]|uniref:Uncharacterized protein n=1 Tax=Streptomyces chengmaiensis TaxID=3040919 RepID=A0ABT6HN36_9ACTN|nr:hypothetical protein [Streptomyces chengmaiensis]MDH2390127.1 hypothetical protein [Streptomyces chengmaiensis]